jgi:hypothetical protein
MEKRKQGEGKKWTQGNGKNENRVMEKNEHRVFFLNFCTKWVWQHFPFYVQPPEYYDKCIQAFI